MGGLSSADGIVSGIPPVRYEHQYPSKKRRFEERAQTSFSTTRTHETSGSNPKDSMSSPTGIRAP